ncbi:MAG TPA: DNA-binding protein Alba [Methanomicrobia archaeon]|jgi:DNA-binding protein Alba|nr:MAG: DNA-binding protein Alba [archaeon]HHN81759.1 DNA-binding protein Alba [Methanomicrobia archaeon]
MTEENVVYVGNKPPMSYVLAVTTQFNNGANEVVLKARGKAISRAVDVAEIVRNRFIPEALVDAITTGTEELPRKEGGTTNTSTIEIVLKK